MVTSYVDFQEQVGMSHRIEPKLFVWVSNINDMKWTLIQVNSPSKIQAGNLVVLKGVSIYLELHNHTNKVLHFSRSFVLFQ